MLAITRAGGMRALCGGGLGWNYCGRTRIIPGCGIGGEGRR